MKPILKLLSIALFAAAAASPAYAQYTGPGATPTLTTVAEARQLHDEQDVLLRGWLVAQVGHERYRLRDATGEIEVEIDDDDLPSHQLVGANTLLELLGEIDTHRFKPTNIDVHHVRVAPSL